MIDRLMDDDLRIFYLCTNRWGSVASLRSISQKKHETGKPETSSSATSPHMTLVKSLPLSDAQSHLENVWVLLDDL